MNAISLRFEGLERLVDAVRVAPDAVREIMDVRTLEAGEIVRGHAQTYHKFKSKNGQLERSVTVRQTGPAQVEVFLDRNVALYGPFVHEGTRAHKILPVRRKALRYSSGDGFAFRRSVMHPGTKPDRFLYDAADAKKSAIQAHIQSGINDAIQEAGLS